MTHELPTTLDYEPTRQYVEAALFKLLRLDDAVRDLAANRFYALRLPQPPEHDPNGELSPSIVYTRLGAGVDYHLKGPLALELGRFWLDCWALDFDTARELARAVQACLSGYRGTVVLESGATVLIRGIFISALRDFYAPEPVRRFYRSQIELNVHYEEIANG